MMVPPIELDLSAYAANWQIGSTDIWHGAIPADLSSLVGIWLPRDGARRKEIESRTAEMKFVRFVVAERCSQQLFEDLCKLTTIERLHIGNFSRIKDCNSIANLHRLTHLYLTGSPGISSIDAIGTLGKLRALFARGNFGATCSLAFLSQLRQLEGLSIWGGDGTPQIFSDADAIGDAELLRQLTLGSIRLVPQSLRMLAALKKLEYLSIQERMIREYPKGDYQFLDNELHALKTELIRRCATDTEFQKKMKIR